MNKKYIIRLTDEERAICEATVQKETGKSEKLRRATILLKADGLGRATVQRYVAAFRAGGLDGLRRWEVAGPVTDLAAHRDAIREEFTRRPTQIRQFLKGMGLKWQRIRAVPVPPKKLSRSM